MYRQYENPNRLEAELQRLKEEYCIAVEKGADEDTLISLHFSIDDLEERVANFGEMMKSRRSRRW